ncbi:Gldg family protein, partial [Mycobacterium tuberculosis]
ALGVLSARYKFEADWTYGHRNTLTAGSQKLLATLKDPVQVLVFDYPNSDTRRDIESWIGRYQRFKPDVKLDFIDPSANPAKVKQYDITAPGEVVIEYQGRRETLRQMSEALITGALQRLASTGERVVVFLEGHGERSVQPGPGATQNDLTQLAEALKGKGLKVQSLNLVKTP